MGCSITNKARSYLYGLFFQRTVKIILSENFIKFIKNQLKLLQRLTLKISLKYHNIKNQ